MASICHPSTARQYTDFGLLTANEDLCSDVNEVFKQLTGLGRAGRMKHLWQAPFTLHKRLVAAIRNEAKRAAGGEEARIIAKMNALLEPVIIAAMRGMVIAEYTRHNAAVASSRTTTKPTSSRTYSERTYGFLAST